MGQGMPEAQPSVSTEQAVGRIPTRILQYPTSSGGGPAVPLMYQ